MSATKPSRSRRSDTPSSPASASSTPASASEPATGSPATIATAPISASAGSASARARTSWPFQSLTRPTSATAKASAGIPSASRACSRGGGAGTRGSPSRTTTTLGASPNWAATAPEIQATASARRIRRRITGHRSAVAAPAAPL
jgi:hypothetical protein